MEEKLIKKVENDYCINSHRLHAPSDYREWNGINFLLGNTGTAYIRVDEIRNNILCMDTGGQNYNHLSEKKKQIVKKLLGNEEIVNIVLFTLFQWLGTNVGRGEIGELLDRIRKTPILKD